MSTERTPLTSQMPPRPSYIFPGVSPRSKRRQLRQFQCCVCTLFLVIFGLGLVIVISYAVWEKPSQTTIPEEMQSTLPPIILDPDPLNATELLNLLITIKNPIQDEPLPVWAIPNPLLVDKVEAQNYGIKALGDKEILEENMATVPVNTPSYRHYRSLVSTAQSRKLSRRGFIEYHATKHLAKKYNYTKPKGRKDIGRGPKLSLPDPTRHFKCDFNQRYRTTNGTCNNKLHPRSFGSTLIPFRRSLRPDYGDGISSPRESHTGGVLPSARQVSLEIHRPSYATDPNFTVMLAVWGQFLDHDITATAAGQGQDGEAIECCSVKVVHPECFPVLLNKGDPFYDDYNVTCINFVRSAPAPTGRFGPREQLNQASAFIDGSVIYGTNDAKTNSLRSKTGGELRMFVTADNRTLLPISTDPNDGCNQKEKNKEGKYCFESGDDRANENLHLTSMHLIFARHHNFLAQNLQKVNPDWDDETVFQEARKILGAQMQHITYNEFLPILLGDEIATAKGIISNSSSEKDTYNPAVNPSIANCFATAAFRFAHTLIPGLMRMTADNSTVESIQLHKMLFNPFSLWGEEGVDKAIGSAINTLVNKVDQFFSTELTEKLFEQAPSEDMPVALCGLDLVSLNIQRGRDHGIPAYSEWRKHCKLPPTDTWDQMANAIDPDSLANMKKIFNDPKDVDMYSGALSEPPLEGAIIGPLLTCLISDQFIRLKAGDSHWYERKIGPQRFTKDQLNEIYKTTLAGLICQNADALDESQKFVMERLHDVNNPYVPCDELKAFNFTPWSSAEQKEILPIRVKMDSQQSSISGIANKSETPSNITL